MKNLVIKYTSILLAFVVLASCASINSTQKGAGIGAGGGAAIGGIIGAIAGDEKGALLGAAIGAAVGGTTGAIIGKQMDKQAQAIESTIPGAEVEKINNGEALEVTFDGNQDGITFPTNKYELDAASKENLAKLSDIFQEFPDTYLRVKGYTDDVGKEDYNMTLSKNRAESVSKYLLTQGIDPIRIETQWFGETLPKVANDSPGNRAKNRRVEVLIVPSQKMVNKAQNTSVQ
ncbi:MAG: OmpA family protein [Bacteroidales bacterium]